MQEYLVLQSQVISFIIGMKEYLWLFTKEYSENIKKYFFLEESCLRKALECCLCVYSFLSFF